MAFLFFFTLGGVCLGSNLLPGAEATPFIKDFIIAFFIFYLSSFLLVCTSARSRSHLWSSLRGVCSCAWTMLLRARARVLDEKLLESDDVVLYIVLKDSFSLSFLAPGLPAEASYGVYSGLSGMESSPIREDRPRHRD